MTFTSTAVAAGGKGLLVTGDLSLKGVTKAITLDVDMTQTEWTYTGHDMISVPSSFKGQKLTVHADAHDANGLSANLVDFMCDLR